MRVDEHTIEVDGGPVFYRSATAQGVPVLYLHGVPTSSDDWVPFLERTGGLAPDLIGFGRSSKAGNLDYSPDGHADFIERVLDRENIARVRLVAHDWGAAGGLVFAQRDPQRIERLVLIDALPLLEGFTWGRFGRICRRPGIGELAIGSVTRGLMRRALRRACTSPEAWSDERVAEVWEQFDQGTQRAILRLHRAAGPEQLAAAGANLDSLAMPALVAWGERDPWLAAEFADRYAERLPRGQAERIPEAGHWPWLDRPEVLDRVVAFLDGE